MTTIDLHEPRPPMPGYVIRQLAIIVTVAMWLGALELIAWWLS